MCKTHTLKIRNIREIKENSKQISVSFLFAETDKMIWQFTRKCKGPRVDITILEKKKLQD